MTDLVKIALVDSNVKNSTIKQYSTQIKKIFEILQIIEPYNETDYYSPILRLQELICYFEDNQFSQNTKKNYLSILITLSKLPVVLDSGLQMIYHKNKELLYELFSILKYTLDKTIKPAIISKKEINTFLKEQKADLDDMSSYQNFVLLHLFNNILTINIKINFSKMLIINDYKKSNDYNDDLLVWDDINKKYYFIVKNFHKKSKKSFTEYFIGGTNTLLHKLLLPLVNYRNETGEKYLFINKLNKPFTKNNFTNYTKRLFKKVYNKDISINDFIRMFNEDKDMNIEYQKIINKILK